MDDTRPWIMAHARGPEYLLPMHRGWLYPIRMTLGVLMLALGLFLLVRIYILGLTAATGHPLMDAIFGAFFILRGVMNLRPRKAVVVPPGRGSRL